jgi:hypothetical protein
MADISAQPGELNWRLSAHPITLITFLIFRVCKLLTAPTLSQGIAADHGFQRVSCRIS